MSGEGCKSKSSRHHKSHHSKGHHSKSHKCDHAKKEGGKATEDIYGVEPESSKSKKKKKKKKKKHYHRPRHVSMTRLFFSTSWIPYWVNPDKYKYKHKHKHRSKRSKELSQARSEPRVREWVERVDPPSIKPPSIKPPSIKPPSIIPPSPGLPPSGSSALGPPSLGPPGQATPAQKPPSQGFSVESNPPVPPPQIPAAQCQQEAKATSAASNNGRNTVRGAPPSENTITSRKSRPRNDSGPGASTSRSASRRSIGDNSSQRRKTEDEKTRKQNHEFTVEADRKIPEQKELGRARGDALAKEERRRELRRMSKDIQDCMAPDRRMTHQESTAERNRQEGSVYHQTAPDWVRNENGHGKGGTQSVVQASRGQRHEDEKNSGRRPPRSVQHHGSVQHGSARHNSTRHSSARRSSARHGSVMPHGSYDPPVYGPSNQSPSESVEPPTSDSDSEGSSNLIPD
ncbi:uncharacterized protein FTOL_07403 [Fusarium torulosum]|uniref:Uncharacterized protein n=1 Tax=Fusarium torulosum TaxID=33205 RepID=A0AAE8SJP5_9HYPO|nr:uncharacterized protein FTOL_07403 [Fusarium torulosum]